MTNRYLTVVAAALGGAGYLAGGKESGGQYAAIGAGAGAMAGQFINMGFTRKDENEADLLVQHREGDVDPVLVDGPVITGQRCLNHRTEFSSKFPDCRAEGVAECLEVL